MIAGKNDLSQQQLLSMEIIQFFILFFFIQKRAKAQEIIQFFSVHI
jgi:hypothetical protein